MNKQNQTPGKERQLKFAEAGILFVLVLGLTLFLGAKVVTRGGDAEPQVAAEQSPAIETVATGEPAVVADATVAGEAEIAIAEAEAESLQNRPARVVTYAASEQAYFAGEYEEAADLFAEYATEHPQNAWGHYMLGLSRWKADDPEGASEAFTAALDIKPDHLKSRVNHARVLLEMDRAEDARTQLEAALEVDPHAVDANRVLGRVYDELGLLDEAVGAYHTALRMSTDDVWSLNNLGLVYIEQERFEDALPPLAKAALLAGEVACIQNNLGVALERTGHYRDSAAAFERALAADTDYAKAEQSLARVSGLTENESAESVDLAVVAASFTVGAVEVAVASSEFEDQQ